MYIVLAVCMVAFQVYEIFLLFPCLFGKVKGSKSKEVLTYVLLFCLYESETLFVNSVFIKIVVGFAGLIGVTLIYQASWKRRLLASAISFMGMVLLEMVLKNILGYMTSDFFVVGRYDSYLGSMCFLLVLFLVVLIIRNLKNMKSGENIPISNWALTILLPLFSCFLTIQICWQNGLTESDLISYTIVLFVINILVFYPYNKRLCTAQEQSEKEHLRLLNDFQSKQLEIMKQSSDILRKQKHDFMNYISSISYYGKKQKWELLENCIERIIGELQSNHARINTGCVPLDGILSYKFQKAEKLGIQMNTDIKIPEHLELEPYDITTLFGALLDNCIEGTENMQEKWLYVRVFYKQGRLNVITRNPYVHELNVKNGMHQNNKENREQHGYGLQNIKNIVDRYDGVCNINTHEEMFEVKITLFL